MERVAIVFMVPLPRTKRGNEYILVEMCRLLGINKTRTTPYRPQSDGLVERFNRTLQMMLSAYVNNHHDDWDDHLPYVCMAYRSSVQESTHFTPNKLMLGRETTLPIDRLIGTPPYTPKFVCHTDYVQKMQFAMEKSFQHMRKAAVRQKRNYDKRVQSQSFAA
uniref:Integrase catalytic domain-containing protein n=1 Tax=Ciona intestinalis TaxID=7719 RepID=H2XKC2_CIOIN